jgi:hypothetical protein
MHEKWAKHSLHSKETGLESEVWLIGVIPTLREAIGVGILSPQP